MFLEGIGDSLSEWKSIERDELINQSKMKDRLSVLQYFDCFVSCLFHWCFLFLFLFFVCFVFSGTYKGVGALSLPLYVDRTNITFSLFDWLIDFFVSLENIYQFGDFTKFAKGSNFDYMLGTRGCWAVRILYLNIL